MVTGKTHKNKGFSLLELILTTSIITIVFTAGAPILHQVNRQFILNRTRVELQSEARSIMYVITRSLRQAQSSTIILSRASTSQPFYSKITFTKIQGDTLVFQQEGTSLIQVIGSGKRILSKNLKYVAFTFPMSDDLGIISVSLTLEKSIFEGKKKALHMASEKVRIMN